MQVAQPIRIGLLNDLHYDGSVPAMNRLYEAVASLNHGDSTLLVVLGDLIDAKSGVQAIRRLHEVAALCGSFRGEVFYMPGNHDLDHISKAEFYTALGQVDATATMALQHGGIHLISIDGNFSPDGIEYSCGNFSWEKPFVPDGQLEWLGQQLDGAHEPVVLLSHQRLDIESDFSISNHTAVREIIERSGKVKAVLQGHQHADDLKQINGIVYYTLAAHVDGAGPAMAAIDTRNILLTRDFRPANAEEARQLFNKTA